MWSFFRFALAVHIWAAGMQPALPDRLVAWAASAPQDMAEVSAVAARQHMPWAGEVQLDTVVEEAEPEAAVSAEVAGEKRLGEKEQLGAVVGEGEAAMVAVEVAEERVLPWAETPL